MAYNAISGTLIAAQNYIPSDLIIGNVVSGNLSTSDGGEIINVPRISNATNNAIITNVGGDANTLVCESNLTFNGTTLDIVGDMTASAGASFRGHVQISSSRGVDVTGSINPSGSNSFSLGNTDNRWKDLYVGTGSIHLGPNGATISTDETGDTIIFNKPFETTNQTVSASMFYGDGSMLYNIRADNVAAEGPSYSIQFHDSVDGDITGSANLLFEQNVLKLNAGLKLNRVSVTATYTASATDYYIGMDSTGGTISLRLPDAAALSDGQTYVVKDEGGAASSNNITIVASGSQTIDGQNQVVLESPYASLQLYCNGTNKYFIC